MPAGAVHERLGCHRVRRCRGRSAPAILAPHTHSKSLDALRLVRLQAVDGAGSRRAATKARTPLAALSIGVSLIGLAVNRGGPGSGLTSLIPLLLVGAALVAGHITARRTTRD